MENNGNYLVKGTELTKEQLQMMSWRGLERKGWKESHSFWFKDGKPSNDDGYYYPVCHSLNYLFDTTSEVVSQ